MIAGSKQVLAAGSPSSKYSYISGSLWEAVGGTNVVDVNRLRFWRGRFQDFSQSGRLSDQKAVDATIEATIVFDESIAAHG